MWKTVKTKTYKVQISRVGHLNGALISFPVVGASSVEEVLSAASNTCTMYFGDTIKIDGRLFVFGLSFVKDGDPYNTARKFIEVTEEDDSDCT